MADHTEEAILRIEEEAERECTALSQPSYSCRTLQRSRGCEGRFGSDLEEEEASGVDAAEKAPRFRPTHLLMMMVAAALAIVVLGEARSWGSPKSDAASPSTPWKRVHAAAPARTLLQAPEVTNLVLVEVRRRVNASIPEDHLRESVRHILREFGKQLDTHLDVKNRVALNNANIGPETWQDIGRLFDAVQGDELVKLGRHAFDVVRNVSATDEDIRLALTGDLSRRSGELETLQARVLPPRVTEALRRFAGGRTPSHGRPSLGLWKGALTREARRPTDTVAQPRAVSIASHVRDLESRTRQPAAVPAALRRLAEAADEDGNWVQEWLSPGDLTGAQLAMAITAIVMVAISEIFVQLQFFVPNFGMPLWVWALIVTPTAATSWFTCEAGFTIWCQIIFGAVGLNLLEDMLISIFAMTSPTQEPFWAKQELLEESRE